MAAQQPSKTKQITQVKLPEWVERASEENYKFARDIASGPMPVYGGPRIADQSNMTTDAYKYLMNNVGAQDPLYRNAAAMQGRVNELDPIYGRAQGILSGIAKEDWDPQEYLNPYTAEVEKKAIANAQRDMQMSLMAQSDKAKRAGAFGGSASGVERGVLAAEGVRNIGDISAELRRAGYDKATADMMADREMRRMTAGDMMTGAQAQGQGWLDSASGMLDTAESRGEAVSRDFMSMLGAGAQEQQFRQSKLDSKIANFYERRDRPLERLNILLSSLGMSPYGKTENVTKTGTSEQPGPDFATMGLGLLQMLPALFSDRRDKTDIEKLGTDEDTGLPIYAYRYKKDPKNTPKIVGPMAQDVEERWPEAVSEIGGHKVIHMGILAAV